jgi:hypothetical protein
LNHLELVHYVRACRRDPWMNHATWVFLNGLSPTQMVTGDLDDNGRDEVIAVFAGAGVWRWSDGSWFGVHGLTPNRLAVGRIDAVPGDDLVVDFPGGASGFSPTTVRGRSSTG